MVTQANFGLVKLALTALRQQGSLKVRPFPMYERSSTNIILKLEPVKSTLVA